MDNTLECMLRLLPQGGYSDPAISVNLNVPLDHYVKCYFPGFKVTAPISLVVTAKLANKGINQANQPRFSNRRGTTFRKSSLPFDFNTGTISNVPSVD